MDKKTIEKFIERLVELTKFQKVKWMYLDGDEELANKLDLWTHDELYDGPDFEIDNSFYSNQTDRNVNLILYQYRPNGKTDLSTVLCVAPTTFKNLLRLNDTDYPEQITRLLNVVKRQFPNPYDFIDDILKSTDNT